MPSNVEIMNRHEAFLTVITPVTGGHSDFQIYS